MNVSKSSKIALIELKVWSAIQSKHFLLLNMSPEHVYNTHNIDYTRIADRVFCSFIKMF